MRPLEGGLDRWRELGFPLHDHDECCRFDSLEQDQPPEEAAVVEMVYPEDPELPLEEAVAEIAAEPEKPEELAQESEEKSHE